MKSNKICTVSKVLLLLLFTVSQAYGQQTEKRFSHCGASLCTDEALLSVDYMLSKRTYEDTTMAYHLLGNIHLVNNSQIDSTIFYLDMVIKRDPGLMNFHYAYGVIKDENLSSIPSDYIYFIRRNSRLEKKYINFEQVEINMKDIEGNPSYDNEFIAKIDKIDRGIREEINENQKLIKALKVEGTRELLMKRDSLYEVMKMNDNIVFSMLLSKVKNDPSFLKTPFTSSEKLRFFTILLHVGENILSMEDLISQLYKEKLITLNQLEIVVGRSYCLRYTKSPLDCVHCETDKKLNLIFKSELPKLYSIHING